MEILKSIGLWALVVILVVLLWRPFWHFVGKAAENAYSKAVAIGGTIFLVVAISLIFYLFGVK